MQSKKLALIGVPSSAGARRTGLEGGPAAVRAAGLVARLRDRGIEVEDRGDLPVVTFRPDPEHPRRQNLPLVAGVAELLADRVEAALDDDLVPLVIGGDCSLGIGLVAGLERHYDSLGLVYFDGDLDLNTPETTPSGVFDGMVMAHLLGRGAPELGRLDSGRPLLAEENVALFGYDANSGWIDPPELEQLERSAMLRYPLERVRVDPALAASAALTELTARADRLLVHFDIDVTDTPATDVPHPNGLDLSAALTALEVFVASEACAAIAVTEINAERDPDLVHTTRLVEGLVVALGSPQPEAS